MLHWKTEVLVERVEMERVGTVVVLALEWVVLL